LAYSQGIVPPDPLPEGVTSGKGWQVFGVVVVLFDPTKGHVNGNVNLQGWTIPGQSSNGQVQASFSTSFDLNNDTVLTPVGNTKLVGNAGQGDVFASEGNPTYLEIRAPNDYGYSALWKGKGKWKYLPEEIVEYKAYALDAHAKPGFSDKGDIFHLVVTHPKEQDKVLFDSNPSYQFDSLEQKAVAGGSVTVTNPPPTDVHSITQDDYNRQKSALIAVSVVAGIFGVALLLAIGAIVYMRLESGFSKSGGSRTVVVPPLGK